MWKRNYQYFINEIFMHVSMSVEYSLKWNKEFIKLSLTKDCQWQCSVKLWMWVLGNLSVNWPKLLGLYQNAFTTVFRCVCVRNVTVHHFQYKEVNYYFLIVFQINLMLLIRRNS